MINMHIEPSAAVLGHRIRELVVRFAEHAVLRVFERFSVGVFLPGIT